MPGSDFPEQAWAEGTAVMKDLDGYRGISKRWIQGWDQGLALAFLSGVLISDSIQKDGAL